MRLAALAFLLILLACGAAAPIATPPPTRTPKPVPTATLAPAATAAPTATPPPTRAATPVPTATLAATPTATTGPAPTVAPTATAAPTATLAPTSTPVPFALSSAAFSAGSAVPVRYTCQGQDISPALSWNAPPAGTQTLALVMDDPDAPVGTWVHWVAFNIPAGARVLPENQPRSPLLPGGGVQGTNSWGRTGYGGPCPPAGPAHRYQFFLYAVDTSIGLTSSATKQQLLAALEGHILAQVTLLGTYQETEGGY